MRIPKNKQIESSTEQKEKSTKNSEKFFKNIMEIYNLMLKKFGYQNWWPGDSPIEIIVGAILTQQTNWKNVERAINNLKDMDLLNKKALSSGGKNIRKAIKPSGYFRQKTERLSIFFNYVIENYHTLENFLDLDTINLRKKLLEIKGIGPETADSILCYAAIRKIFVVDEYTFRILERLGLYVEKRNYHELQKKFQANLPDDIEIYRDFHAQFVAMGKEHCKVKPSCGDCPLRSICKFKIKNNL